MPIVLTSCTNRKRAAASQELIAVELRRGGLDAVAADWGRRLRASTPVAAAAEIYCGRAFRQAEQAANALGAELYVVSAGLGLVSANRKVPSYSLTVVPGTHSVLDHIAGRPSPADWWRKLSRSSPFAMRLEEAAKRKSGPILAALPLNYISMVADEFESLHARTRARLRIFTLSPREAIPEVVRAYVLPYDARFDGAGSPVPGTRGDFAQRALAHFAEAVWPRMPKANFDEHAEAVERILRGLRPREVPSRTKMSDAQITALIHRHWGDASGQSSRMLRYMRDTLGVACEQSRFKGLFNAAKHARGEAS